MLTFRDMVPEDYALFQAYVEGVPYSNSNYSFANMYVWREHYHIQIAPMPEALYVRGRVAETDPYAHYQPMTRHDASLPRVLEQVEADCKEHGSPFLIYGADEHFVRWMRQEDLEGVYQIEPDRDNFEYVYETEKLARLSGKKLHGKRNHVNAFVKKYAYQVEELDGRHTADCMQIFDEWAQDREAADTAPERAAIQQALQYREQLHLCGLIVYVEGRPVAFTVGEQYHPEIALVHFEKAVPDIDGGFPFVNQQFAQWWEGKVPCINRAEDMGVEGMRKAKLSYRPCHMIHKYTIRK